MADEEQISGTKWRPTWHERNPVRPYDGVFECVNSERHRCRCYTTDECLRILAASGFTDPVFEWASQGPVANERCMVTGPDGERHNGGQVLALIFRAERLESLCKDRSDAVLGMIRRENSC